MAHARLHHKKEALEDLAKFQKGDGTESSKLYLATVVAAELGEGVDEAFGKLGSALNERPRDSGLHYDAACAYALASQALSRTGPAKSRDHAARAIQLLRLAIQNGYSDYGHMQEDADLDPIRGLPAFAEVMKAGHPDRRYAAVWTSGATHDVTPIHGLDPAAHLQRCQELGLQGYRIRSVSVTRTIPEGPLVTASVWHRPVVSEDVKDELAKHQARAVIALVRLGKAEAVFPLLRHSSDPRLRSFVVNWLNPLGADPKNLAGELDRLDRHGSPEGVGRGSPDPAQSPDRRSAASGVAADSVRPSVPGRAGSGDPRPTPANAMEGILFHPDTSIRRALILALGTFGTDRLSPGEREPLIDKLLDLYRNDPDAGIHGAAESTLRRWQQREKLKATQAELTKVKEWDGRRWYVNGQGQTFVIVEGPVEFRMGSPASEPDRYPQEISHRRVIPRRFAIADKEVSVEQYQRFVNTNPQFGGLDPSFLTRYSPDPSGPMISVNWYGAAAYCNWLSEQEGLPKDQWCYLRNAAEAYSEGMTIPANVLARTGYRLPTEAEWECACRAGTITSRYHGLSIDLLEFMLSIKPTAKTMPRRGEACCPTTWGCSTCWETCLNGVKIPTAATNRERKDLL
ncbi:MAG: formylglycine-generating enzyme family protein [Isosphaerales bacterium]